MSDNIARTITHGGRTVEFPTQISLHDNVDQEETKAIWTQIESRHDWRAGARCVGPCKQRAKSRRPSRRAQCRRGLTLNYYRLDPSRSILYLISA